MTCIYDRTWIHEYEFQLWPYPFNGTPAIPVGETLGFGPNPYAKTGAGWLDDPVNTATGNFAHEETDLSFPKTVGPQLKFVRTYNSFGSNDAPAAVGSVPFADGWSSSWSDRLEFLPNGDIQFHAGNGSTFYFQKSGSSYVAAAGVTAALSTISGGYEITRADQTKLDFDSNGYLTAIKDRNNQALSFSYDSNSRLATATDAVGRSFSFTYNSSGQLTTLAGSDGRSVSYGYDTAGRLSTATDVRGKTWTFNYGSSSDLLQSETDPRGNQVFKVLYDSNSRVSDQYDAFNNHTAFAYNTSTQTATVTDPTGAVTKDIYSSGLLAQRIDPLNHSTTYAYDSAVNLTSITDAAGKTTTMGYDGNGNMTSRTAPTPLSYSESWTYNSKNDPLTYVDRRSKTTSYGYDSNSNLTTITRPGSNVTTFGYDSGGKGELVSITDPNGKQTTYGYDSLGERRRRPSRTGTSGPSPTTPTALSPPLSRPTATSPVPPRPISRPTTPGTRRAI